MKSRHHRRRHRQIQTRQATVPMTVVGSTVVNVLRLHRLFLDIICVYHNCCENYVNFAEDFWQQCDAENFLNHDSFST